jgi:hypothetical protein
MRRRARFIAVSACAAALAAAPVAAQADVVPAPPGHAAGVAARVGKILDISRTGATADNGSPSADAWVVDLGNQSVLNLGGNQKGDGQTAGSIVDTGASLPVRVEVAPWHAAADGSAGPTRHARGSAAVARANMEKVLHVGVLTSDSEASYTQQKSTGTAVTDGVQLGILDAINVVLLHSEVSSEGRGHSYLVNLNGTQIGTNDQLGASPLCALNANVLSLSCLTATGGNAAGGATQAAAQVAQVTPAVDQLSTLNPVALFTTAGSSGTGQAPALIAPAIPATPAPAVAAGETSRAAAPASIAPATRAAGLPRTGTDAGSLAALAAAILLAGSAFRRFAGRLSVR